MSLIFTNYILDNVHGYIGLTKAEAEIEKLPIFKRLQYVKQLGLAHWIFPGSEHTRYIHSLGVMYIIDEMAKKLNFSDEDRQLVRLSAMLHDIGHYPLSHVGEKAYKEALVGDNQLDALKFKSLGKIQALTASNPVNDALNILSPDPLHHENVGISILKNSSAIISIINKYCSYIDMDDLYTIVSGDYSATEKKPQLSPMIQLLHSEFDADKIDYLLRDATFSGANYGRFELGTLIKNLRMKKHSVYGIDIVGVKEKGIGAADQFLINRHFSYREIIYNKKVNVIAIMAQTVMNYIIYSNDIVGFPNKETFLNNMQNHEKNSKFLGFTDQYFINFLYHIDTKNPKLPYAISKMISNLKTFSSLKLASTPISLSGFDSLELQNKLKQTDLYKRISNKDYCHENKVAIVNEISITPNVPIEKFKASYEKEKFKLPIEHYLSERLQNGLAIIEDDVDPYLLVDSPYSLVKDLSNNKIVNLREYIL
ncbi:HD domain-containing protein [Clostridium cellulovorans]|uniref:Metal dependent phosphohydrolase n=1 Tax=Clostridium cellulovorans (strain ATCC 35296 / DSM 3052 / OCM 3 / 743B) TaxID=573061 RepID=D9SKZ4_CLOC7|nr:HD domain-containing protein [Clostridium cellulovorans]ADL53566.1 metal dependent phosphohydrolase [Clostridium cellulovorans 743B]